MSVVRTVERGVVGLMLLAVLASNACAESWRDAAPMTQIAALQAAGVEDDWFKLYLTAPGVFAITEPRQVEGVSSFLIVGSKRALLFDSGLGLGRISDVVRRLTMLPVIVVNSHTHFDHVGGNERIRGRTQSRRSLQPCERSR